MVNNKYTTYRMCTLAHGGASTPRKRESTLRRESLNLCWKNSENFHGERATSERRGGDVYLPAASNTFDFETLLGLFSSNVCSRSSGPFPRVRLKYPLDVEYYLDMKILARGELQLVTTSLRNGSRTTGFSLQQKETKFLRWDASTNRGSDPGRMTQRSVMIGTLAVPWLLGVNSNYRYVVSFDPAYGAQRVNPPLGEWKMRVCVSSYFATSSLKYYPRRRVTKEKHWFDAFDTFRKREQSRFRFIDPPSEADCQILTFWYLLGVNIRSLILDKCIFLR